MAQWTAKVFVNSNVGEITANVEASTYPGARQQIENIYGPVQSIFNLREVSSNGGGAASGGNGCLALIGLAGLILIGGVASTTGGGDDYTPSETYENAPVERVEYAPKTSTPNYANHSGPCITENFEPC